MDSTSPQKVIFTIYLNIEYSLCNSVGETFLLHLVLAGEGEGWGDDAATREDVTGGEGDMEDVTGEGDMEKEKERQKLHNLLQILDILDLDHS